MASGSDHCRRPLLFVPPGHEPHVVARPDGVKELPLDAGEPSTLPRSAYANANGAIPERPLHLCPTCQYNLTGLTHRRCPECGESFTLLDAIRVGAEGPFAVGAFADHRAMRRATFISILSLAAIAIGTGVPIYLAMQWLSAPALMVVFVVSVSGINMLGWLLWSAVVVVDWHSRLLGCGIIALVVGALATLLVVG